MKNLAKSLMILFLFAGISSTLEARDNGFRIRLGIFTPEGDSQYWNENALDFVGDADDFEDFQGGLDYDLGLTNRSVLRFSVDSFSGESDTHYFDFVDNEDFFIEHSTTLDIASVTAAYVIQLASPNSPVMPYLGVGGGIYAWELTEDGDFIDFLTDDLEIFSGVFSDSGVALGYFYSAGVEFRFTQRNAFLVEGRWQEVNDELEGDFDGFGELDLSGLSIYGGYSWKF